MNERLAVLNRVGCTTMDEKKIWIVAGSCGSYSDREDWTVAAYEKQEDAEQHARLAEAAGSAKPNRFDLAAHASGEDLKYTVYSVTLNNAPPSDMPPKVALETLIGHITGNMHHAEGRPGEHLPHVCRVCIAASVLEAVLTVTQ